MERYTKVVVAGAILAGGINILGIGRMVAIEVERRDIPVPTYPMLLESNPDFDIFQVAPRYGTGYNLITLNRKPSIEDRPALWTKILASLNGVRGNYNSCKWDPPVPVQDNPSSFLTVCR